eukprot:Lithocolla_globosa_v1_NODE_3980_length_1538_cov_7.366824.p2 type:complete len:115 gc:universal NODE_3980_length_1538_cov_7.366824:745-401(-)
MLLDFVQSPQFHAPQPLRWLQHQNLSDEIARFFWKSIGNGVLELGDFLKSLVLVGTFERGFPGKQLKQNTTQSPHIRRFACTFVSQQLGGHIFSRSNKRIRARTWFPVVVLFFV